MLCIERGRSPVVGTVFRSSSVSLAIYFVYFASAADDACEGDKGIPALCMKKNPSMIPIGSILKCLLELQR